MEGVELIAGAAALEMPLGGETGSSLSKRQMEVLILLTEGLSSKEIAQQMGISRRMVTYHVQLLMGKLKVQSTGQLVGRAVAMGLCKAR